MAIHIHVRSTSKRKARTGWQDAVAAAARRRSRDVSYNALVSAHEKEARQKGAEFRNLGWGSDDDSIVSKTSKGILETRYESGKFIHMWSSRDASSVKVKPSIWEVSGGKFGSRVDVAVNGVWVDKRVNDMPVSRELAQRRAEQMAEELSRGWSSRDARQWLRDAGAAEYRRLTPPSDSARSEGPENRELLVRVNRKRVAAGLPEFREGEKLGAYLEAELRRLGA